jgi:hypothetical protein
MLPQDTASDSVRTRAVICRSCTAGDVALRIELMQLKLYVGKTLLTAL